MTRMRFDTSGKRPAFFDDPAVDSMMTILLELMSDHWAVRERLYALERLLEKKGAIRKGAVESWTWSKDDQEKLAARQQQFLQDVFRTLDAEYQSRKSRQEEIDSL